VADGKVPGSSDNGHGPTGYASWCTQRRTRSTEGRASRRLVKRHAGAERTWGGKIRCRAASSSAPTSCADEVKPTAGLEARVNGGVRPAVPVGADTPLGTARSTAASTIAKITPIRSAVRAAGSAPGPVARSSATGVVASPSQPARPCLTTTTAMSPEAARDGARPGPACRTDSVRPFE